MDYLTYTQSFPWDYNHCIEFVKICLEKKEHKMSQIVLMNLFQYVDEQKNINIRKLLKTIKITSNESVSIKPTKLPLITVLITSCRRTDLLDRTIKSFLYFCKDIEYICEWILIDDNTPNQELEVIKAKYNFLKVVQKDQSDKGHARSLNIGVYGLKTKYTFILEDDWEFIGHFSLMNMMNILQSDPSYGQCLVNQHYTEEIDDEVSDGVYLKTDIGTRYILHGHQKLSGPTTYWPHFSLRPGLTNTSILREFEFDENTCHFELDFAYKYSTKYKTCFLPGIYSLHIGRLTKHYGKGENAYDLNGEKQFKDEIKPHHEDISLSKIHKYLNSSDIKVFNADIPKCIVVNLEQRNDRRNHINDELSREHIQATIFNAIDGSSVQQTRQFFQLFRNNHFQYRSGMIGCALSHICIWIELLSDDDNDHYIVFEDDAKLEKNFKLKLSNLFNKKWDMVFLGHHKKNSKSGFFSSKESFQNSLGGTFGYIISKHAAKELLKMIDTIGVINAIDTMIQRVCDVLKVLYLDNHLVTSPMVSFDKLNGVDSDIQYDMSHLRIPLQQRVEHEMNTLKSMNYDYKFISSVEPIDKITFCNYDVMKQYTREVVNTCHVYNIERHIVMFIPQSILNEDQNLKNIFVNYRLIDYDNCIKLDMVNKI